MSSAPRNDSETPAPTERELVTRRYLARTGLARTALARLAELDGDTDAGTDTSTDTSTDTGTATGATTAPARPLAALRHDAVLAALREQGATSVLDLGCGPGAFLQRLLASAPAFTRVGGCDVSVRALQLAARRLHVDTMSERQAERLELFQGAVTYEDERFGAYDAVVLMEVIEHVDESRLPALERAVLGAGARVVVVTTPNAEYNALYEHLDGLRHSDHRFEWDRATFQEWVARVAARYGYTARTSGIGDADATLGAPTQMAVLTRE